MLSAKTTEVGVALVVRENNDKVWLLRSMDPLGETEAEKYDSRQKFHDSFTFNEFHSSAIVADQF